MEIVFFLVQNQDPELVGRDAAPPTAAPAGAPSALSRGRAARGQSADGPTLLQRVQQAKAPPPAGSRHTHFGGVFRVDTHGTRAFATSATADPLDLKPKAARRRDRRMMPFNGSGNAPATGRTAEAALKPFCQAFLADAYQPFMKSLKTEFRLETARLNVEEDKSVYFQLTGFFLALRRHSRPADSDADSEALDAAIVVASMDLFRSRPARPAPTLGPAV
jgi:hypothetical protein